MKEPRTVSKATFECLALAILLILTVAEVSLAVFLSRALPRRGDSESFWIGALVGTNVVLSRLAADRLLKLLGRSRSGKTREIQGRSAAFAEGQVGDDEAVEVYFSPSLCRVGIVASLFWLVVLSLSLDYMGPGELGGRVYWVYGLIAFAACGVVSCWVLLYKPLARADAEGLRGYREGLSVFSRFIPWSEITTCELETFFDTFGTPVLVRPTVKDKHGERLLRLDLRYSRIEDQDRLVKYIKAKLPKPQLDAWDAEGVF